MCRAAILMYVCVCMDACERRTSPHDVGPKQSASNPDNADSRAVSEASFEVSDAYPVENPLAPLIDSNDHQWRIAYSTKPSPIVANQSFTIEVRVESTGGSPISGKDLALAVDAAMPEHGHGMNVEPKVTARGEGVFVVEGMAFHMPGRWELYFDITRDGMTSRAQDEITLE